ncbi:MAG: ribonuclease PH [Candidatus Thermoplasmatota archaeon]|nr:ribonuclease PH [Candidatus Thermoplasmatota archaeon]MBS3789562.1 ribonuclease PH [Candidatus Thermoplasmatota archaeon]
MARGDRANDELRETSIKPHYLENPKGSALIETGKTKVICTVMVEESLPPWINEEEADHGWLTAKYGMLPGSGEERIRRERRGAKGRTKEIQRLIGRSLRAGIDLKKIGPRTLWIDCDVLQADGGTRTASITGAWVALKLAVQRMIDDGDIDEDPMKRQVAATSVGVIEDEERLDLCYEDDFNADVDMNVVMDHEGNFIEVQATGEEAVFTREQHDKLLDLAEKGIKELLEAQKKVLK